jgi:hypothetical protein
LQFCSAWPEAELVEVPCNNWPHRNQRGDGRENAYEQGNVKLRGLMHLRGVFLLLRFGKLLLDPFAGLPALFIIIQIVRTAPTQLAANSREANVLKVCSVCIRYCHKTCSLGNQLADQMLQSCVFVFIVEFPKPLFHRFWNLPIVAWKRETALSCPVRSIFGALRLLLHDPPEFRHCRIIDYLRNRVGKNGRRFAGARIDETLTGFDDSGFAQSHSSAPFFHS